MSLTAGSHSHHADSFPRVSGDEPPTITDFMGWLAFSPRERG